MSNSAPQKTQLKLRLPKSLHDQIVRRADRNKRSLNSQIVHELQQHSDGYSIERVIEKALMKLENSHDQ